MQCGWGKRVLRPSSTESWGCCSCGAARVGSKMQLPRVKLHEVAAQTIRFRVPRALERREATGVISSPQKSHLVMESVRISALSVDAV